jgi:hypothetical protein
MSFLSGLLALAIAFVLVAQGGAACHWIMSSTACKQDMDPGCEHWQDFAPGDCRSVGYPYCFIGAYWEYYWARDDGPSCARAAEAIKTFGQETSGCYGESEPLPECKNSSNTTAMPLHALAKNSDSNWHVIDLNVVGVLVSAMFMAVGLVSLAMPMKFRYAGSVADPGPLLGQSVL